MTTATTRPAPSRSDRLLAARRARVRAGRHFAGTAPFGYRRGAEPGSLLPDPHEAPQVRTIFRTYLETGSLQLTERALRQAGITSRRNRPLSRAAIGWILRNPTYVGQVRFGTIRARGQHEPIVEPALFRKVQRRLNANRKRPIRAAAR